MKKEVFNLNEKHVNEVDAFLSEFVKTHKRSESELAEIRKHQKIAKLRDNEKKDAK